MDAWEMFVNGAVGVTSVATLVGLIVRGRARRTWAFVVYLAVMAAYSLAIAVFPGLITWRAWLLKELLQSALALAVAIEISVRVFAGTPSGARTARTLVVLLLAATGCFLFLDLPAPSRPPFTQTSPAEVAAFETAIKFLPRLAYGTACLCGALFALATLQILQLDPLHRVVTIGFGSYLSAYTALLWDLPAEPTHARWVSHVLTWSYLAVLAVWAWAAWREEHFPGRHRVCSTTGRDG